MVTQSKILFISIIFILICLLSTLIIMLNRDNGSSEIYPKFSISEFKAQREYVKEYFLDELKEINDSPTLIKSTQFAIAIEDVNDDKIDDILAIISNPYFSGYQHNGLFTVFMSEKEEMKHVPLTEITIDWNNLKTQQQIKLIDEDEDIMDIEIDSQLWKWEGNRYNKKSE